MNVKYQLTIFYDGDCPLCVTEMNHLQQHDAQDKIEFVDIQQEGFESKYPQIDYNQAMSILHGVYQGQLLFGLAVTHRAWTLVGKGFWVAPLNWPIIKTVSHWVYLLIARYRQPISGFLSKCFHLKANRCETGICYEKRNNTDHRRK